MEYLILVLIGLASGRYILPIFDLILEFLNQWLTQFIVKISLNTERDKIQFNKDVESTDDPNRIGFQHTGLTREEYYEDDDCEEDKCNIGFKSNKK